MGNLFFDDCSPRMKDLHPENKLQMFDKTITIIGDIPKKFSPLVSSKMDKVSAVLVEETEKNRSKSPRND